jgi:hypothetical protein
MLVMVMLLFNYVRRCSTVRFPAALKGSVKNPPVRLVGQFWVRIKIVNVVRFSVRLHPDAVVFGSHGRCSFSVEVLGICPHWAAISPTRFIHA